MLWTLQRESGLIYLITSEIVYNKIDCGTAKRQSLTPYLSFPIKTPQTPDCLKFEGKRYGVILANQIFTLTH